VLLSLLIGRGMLLATFTREKGGDMAGTVAGKVRLVGKATARGLGLVAIVALFRTLAAGAAQASTLTVSNTSDSGAGSLRAAIIAANNEVANPGHDTIAFDIPTSDSRCDADTKVCTITPPLRCPLSPLR
jgi:hypothetical protein